MVEKITSIYLFCYLLYLLDKHIWNWIKCTNSSKDLMPTNIYVLYSFLRKQALIQIFNRLLTSDASFRKKLILEICQTRCSTYNKQNIFKIQNLKFFSKSKITYVQTFLNSNQIKSNKKCHLFLFTFLKFCHTHLGHESS